MIDQRKESSRPTMEENEKAVERCMERMMNEAREFAEMVHRNQTSCKWDKNKPHGDDWDVGDL